MSSVIKNKIIKSVLLLSGISFLGLIVADRTVSFVGCIVVAAAWGVVLLKSSITCEKLQGTMKTGYAVLALGLCSALGCNFYDRWIGAGKTQRISAFLGVTPDKVSLIGTAVVILAAVPMVSTVLSYFIAIVLEDFRVKRDTRGVSMVRAIVIMSMIYLLGISAILRADFNYVDDMGRVANGSKGWINYSRFLTEALSSFIHMDTYLTDVSPLPQLIAVMFLAVSGIVLLYIISEMTSYSAWEMSALLLLGLNPYFLECLSYKYDSPYMVLSILGAIVPFLYKKKKGIIYVFASMIGMVIVCTTYQAATGIYPMIVILLMLKMWCDNKPMREIGKFCLWSVIGYGSGMAFFYFILMVPVDAAYGTGLASTNLRDLAEIVYYNMRSYYTYVRSDFKAFWLILVLALAMGFLWTTARSSKRNKVFSLLMAMVSLLLMGMVCFGVYPAVARTLFAPRAMYGFGVLLTLMGIYVAEKCGAMLFRLPALLLGLAFFVFSFTYGNALSVQKEYIDFRIQMVVDELNDMDVFLSEQPVVVQISGTVGYSPVIRYMPQNYNILNRLVPITFQGGWWWGQAGFYQYYDLKNVIRDPAVDLTTYDLPIVEDKMYYTIRGRDNYILIELK